MMLRSTSGMVNKLGHFAGRLGDQFCDSGYHYDPSVDNCVPGDYALPGGYCDQPQNAAECSWIDCNATPQLCGSFDPSIDTPTITTDGGNAQIWQQILNAAGKVSTLIMQATNSQYSTRYGTYAYGTGPYSAMTAAQAQQYLASRSTFGGLSSTTLLLLGGGLIVALMMMKR